jgi:hypothetical protein
MRPSWTRSPAARLVRRYATAAGVVLLLTVGVVVATTRDGYAAKAVDLGTGSVWVTSQGPGQLALLDGASAAVTVRLKVADGGHDITAVQGHRAGYAVDRTTGSVIRADAATWQATATLPIDGATAGLTATAAGSALYLTDVQRGLVVKADPDTLQPVGQPQSLSATRGAGIPVADTTGALWLLDSTTGDLIRTVDTPQRTEAGFAGGTGSRLVLVQGAPVVVDLFDRSTTPIDPQTGHRTGSPSCVDTDPTDPTVTVAGSPTDPVVYLASGRDGLLRITDLAGGTCNQAIPLTAPGTDLGEPVDMAGRVFIPNRTTGQVIIIDPKTRHQDLTDPVVPPNTAFELLGQDGFIYYNEPASNLAGVVHTDGTVRPITKYDPTDPDRGVHQDPQPQAESAPPAPDEPATNPAGPSDAVSAAGQAATPPGTEPSAPSTAGSAPTHEPGPPSSTPPTTSPLGPPPPASVPTTPTTPTDPTTPTPEVLTATATGPGTAHIGDQVDLTVTASNGTITHTAWDFGDGHTADTATGSTSHTWTASNAQPYRVKVAITVQDGRTATTELQIQITEQPPTTLTIHQPTGGTVVDGRSLTCPSTCSNAYTRGSSVHLTAHPDTGQLFTGWTGDCTAETSSTCTLTMSADRTVGATFADDPNTPAQVDQVTFAGPPTDPTVTITGKYFQSTAPPSTSASVTTCGEYGPGNGSMFGPNGLWFHDTTATWQAGKNGGTGPDNCVGIVVQKWTSTTIIFKFGVAYNSFDHWYITQDDAFQMSVRGTLYDGQIRLA